MGSKKNMIAAVGRDHDTRKRVLSPSFDHVSVMGRSYDSILCMDGSVRTFDCEGVMGTSSATSHTAHTNKHNNPTSKAIISIDHDNESFLSEKDGMPTAGSSDIEFTIADRQMVKLYSDAPTYSGSFDDSRSKTMLDNIMRDYRRISRERSRDSKLTKSEMTSSTKSSSLIHKEPFDPPKDSMIEEVMDHTTLSLNLDGSKDSGSRDSDHSMGTVPLPMVESSLSSDALPSSTDPKSLDTSVSWTSLDNMLRDERRMKRERSRDSKSTKSEMTSSTKSSSLIHKEPFDPPKDSMIEAVMDHTALSLNLDRSKDSGSGDKKKLPVDSSKWSGSWIREPPSWGSSQMMDLFVNFQSCWSSSLIEFGLHHFLDPVLDSQIHIVDSGMIEGLLVGIGIPPSFRDPKELASWLEDHNDYDPTLKCRQDKSWSRKQPPRIDFIVKQWKAWGARIFPSREDLPQFILFPLHSHYHWSSVTATVDWIDASTEVDEILIFHGNSLVGVEGHDSPSVRIRISLYVSICILEISKGKDWSSNPQASEWLLSLWMRILYRIEYRDWMIPQQKNGYDCGPLSVVSLLSSLYSYWGGSGPKGAVRFQLEAFNPERTLGGSLPLLSV